MWKRNPQYDFSLLSEVELFNPYAFAKQNVLWDEIAQALLEGPLKMKVTGRSCRDRATELLKLHRKGELASLSS